MPGEIIAFKAKFRNFSAVKIHLMSAMLPTETDLHSWKIDDIWARIPKENISKTVLQFYHDENGSKLLIL